MGPKNWRLARLVDEISNSLSHLPPPAAQSFLVLSYLAHCDKVIHMSGLYVFLSLIVVHCRSLRDVEVTDVRSDDEDDDDDDAAKED